MQISSILDYIDNGHMALPEFQRGYVWGREQVRGLFQSLYRGHPVGSLLVWATDASTAAHRGDNKLAPGVVKLLLDGQQRITSLYGVIRGHPPKFFDGNEKAFTDLRFNLETEEFEFFQPIKMRDDPLWIDVTELMKKGNAGIGAFVTELSKDPNSVEKVGDYMGRLNRLLGIRDKAFHIEEVTGADKTLDVVVDIFNRVNSGGTKLSKGDLALAKICADWPEARDTMKGSISRWRSGGYDFSLDWLLRSVNTILTGEAKFLYLHDKSAEAIADALKRAVRQTDAVLNMIAGRLGLDHDRVLFSRFAIPVMVRYLDTHGGKLDEKTRDKLLFWYVQSGMWGRFSASTESVIDKDLGILEQSGGDLDKLIAELRLSQGGLRVEPGHFHSWSVGARFYPVLYMLTRVTEARDWGTGLPLKSNLLGKMNKLEVHHIFPRARLYEADYSRPEVNALANFCFLTKDTNLFISDRKPEEYFPEIENAHPGALASQWIPNDPVLWRVENFRDFLEARKELLSEAANKFLASLLHDEASILEANRPARLTTRSLLGGITSEEEARELEELNDWVATQGYARGETSWDYVDPDTGEQRAILDLAWPHGVQSELTEPVAVLLDESAELISLASSAGFRCFTSATAFKRYVQRLSASGQELAAE
ncbi:GmrSD restriction endonuclease domain-containing protein [Phaeobacter gallaeciensis]|uniref:GmrSD restriction endonuclease domain-containing protein n=1 Tax=Phaeobacter gallaeciensis TaxID=60890 RepID=UPI00237F2D00|nr:DUF262 domain-containing protein [Phaeobacter gallaeciensis]MDE4099222.1 DUF262 domain-containing protein [Phaeobacter gallaeciensis]MDE4107912.1 DUF262 domain-containing protein [Phaeobacter gallaeciensis]MDE4112486.1 DUF262 domain-containing protein [Phaeobacter gallaeciensis]MDE4116837.1 DUF262 domain-containing protein [Phaeobacter gallaeciensis]MDE4121429.1 DUF262 domain-containing protein [Phaeobacter gallaeciensis]